MTRSPHGTFYHLKIAVEYQIDVLLLQVEDVFRPIPACGEGHLDGRKSALHFINTVFMPGIVQVDCILEEVACKIAAVLREISAEACCKSNSTIEWINVCYRKMIRLTSPPD